MSEPLFDDGKPHDIQMLGAIVKPGIWVEGEGGAWRKLLLQVEPDGTLRAVPEVEQPLDQVTERSTTPVASRWMNTDQGMSAKLRGEM